jgi:hypothetical protein
MSLIARITDEPTERHVLAIKAILEMDLDERDMGKALREYCNEHLTDIELGAEVYDRLQDEKIISKYFFRQLWDLA